jgi:hypothetical protein
MLLVATRLGTRVYNPKQLAGLVSVVFTEEEMGTALDAVRNALSTFQAQRGGQIDKIVKGREFTDVLLDATFPQAGTSAP